jgi:hypothetical protein
MDYRHQRRETGGQRDLGYWIPAALLAFMLFGGMLVGAFALGQSSGSGDHSSVDAAVAAQAAKDKKLAAAQMTKARERFAVRLEAAKTKAREEGYVNGQTDAGAGTIADGDAGSGNGSSDPCAGTYDPEGIC